MHEVLVNRLGGLSLPRKSVVRLIGRPDMTLDVYRGRKITIQQQQHSSDMPGMLFCMLMNVKMPSIVVILTFMTRRKFMLSLVEHTKFYNLEPRSILNNLIYVI